MTDKHPSAPATTFTVAFAGKLNGLRPIDVVQQQFAQLFKTNPAQTAQLFSGKKVVLKTGLSKEQAEKYQKAIHQAGGECILEEVPQLTNMKSTPTPTQPTQKKPSPPPLVTPKIDHITIAPVGTMIGEPKKEVVRTFKNLDTITLAKAGEYIPTIPKPPAPPAPDISHLSLKK